MSIDKIKSIAKERFDKQLTDEQAACYAERFGKLTDDELDNVAGGGCTDGCSTNEDCTNCGAKLVLFKSQFGSLYKCPDCGHEY